MRPYEERLRLEKEKYHINPQLDPKYNPDVRDVSTPPPDAKDVSEWWENPDIKDVSNSKRAQRCYAWMIGMKLQDEDTPRDKFKKIIKEIQKNDPLPLRKKPDGTEYYDRDECLEWGKKHKLSNNDKAPPFHEPDGNGGFKYIPREKCDEKYETPFYEPNQPDNQQKPQKTLGEDDYEDSDQFDKDVADFLEETGWIDRKIDEYESNPPSDEDVTEYKND